MSSAGAEVAFVAAPVRVAPVAGPGANQRSRASGQPSQATASLAPAAALVGGAAAAIRSRKARRAARPGRKAFGKFLGNLFPWLDDSKEAAAEPGAPRREGTPSTTWKELLLLKDLGSSAFDKALQVNLDSSIYGSFAEIGAGQEVSRTFLTAGAAAGTVARSLSAYDMQISDVTYGKAARYVTKERLEQMLQTEYDTLEASIREDKGPETRFFAVATTLAAKAYMSDRECEGWVGMTFQHKAGAKPSSVQLHVRMCDDTARAQGEAIGKLGTNLVYLCNFARDPVVITSFLLDAIEEGRLEVDFVEFTGPAFPKESVDYRLLAMKMVEFKVAASVLLMFDESTQRYYQAVPNTTFYKRPLVVQRSRFRPVTYAHREVIQAAAKKLSSELGSDARPVLEILDFQIDDIVRPRDYLGTEGRLRRTRAAVEADVDGDGILTVDNLAKVFAKKLPEDEALQLAKDLDVDGKGRVLLDQVLGWTERCANNVEFLDRFKMLQTLKLPVLVSGVGSDSQLSSYLGRYTREPIILAVGGGNYDIGRGIFQEKNYTRYNGGMLEAFGKLFAGNVRMFQYPNISPEGEVSEKVEFAGPTEYLHRYLVNEGKIVSIEPTYMNSFAVSKESNEPYRGQSEDVVKLMQSGDPAWEKYVPDEAHPIIKQSSWFQRYTAGGATSQQVIYKAFEVLDEIGKQ